MNQSSPTVGLFALHYCTSRMMDVPVVYWPMMPDDADLSAMYSAEKRVRSLVASDQHRAKSDPWRHIRPLPDVFDYSGMDQETRYEFQRNAQVDSHLPDRPRLGFETAWAVEEGRALPPHNLHAQQHREGVADQIKKVELRNALEGAKASGKSDDVSTAEAALREHESRMERRKIIHMIEDLRERLNLAQWAEDSDTAKRLTEKLEIFERWAHAQRMRADARSRGEKELEATYANQEYQIRKELETLNLRLKLDEAVAATARARQVASLNIDKANLERVESCMAAETKIREEFGKLLEADEPESDADATPAA